jgi:hypothetical protein
MIRNKRYFDLTEEEIEKASRLTPKEQAAVDAFIAAAKALPRGITIAVSDWGDRDDGLTISKSITKGSCQQVAHIRKRSLVF